MDPLFLASSRLRRRRYDECIELCDQMLAANGTDKAAWLLKTRALTAKDFVDDTDMEEEGIAEVLMDDNAMAKAPRPGTSLRQATSGGMGGGAKDLNQAFRPVSASGRPLSGFARPSTSSRSANTSIEGAFQGGRPGTSRPVSVAGRYVRLGTQSLLSGDDRFINADRLDVHKYVQRPALAKALCDYLIYSDHNPKKAMELCAAATKASDFKDWWWKARLAKCYYMLGMFRDAEKQFKSAIRHQKMIETHLELGKVYIRLDQPNTALDIYMQAIAEFPGDVSILLGIARVHDATGSLPKSIRFFQKVLEVDASNVEAIASLAGHYFYEDQPEIALRFYRRLIQSGVNNTEIWNNVGLCCFYSGQYDLTLNCFEKAIALSNDDNISDVWYNIGQLAIGIGDLNLAYQCFKIAVSVNPNHAESFNNLGLLELKKQPAPNVEVARSHFENAARLAPHLFEPLYNAGLLSFKLGDCQESFAYATKALTAFPQHEDSHQLIKELKNHFTML